MYDIGLSLSQTPNDCNHLKIDVDFWSFVFSWEFLTAFKLLFEISLRV